MRMVSDGLQNRHLEPFILPDPWPPLAGATVSRVASAADVSPWAEVYPGLADRGVRAVSARLSGGRQIALVKHNKHLGGCDLRHPIHEVMLAHEPIGLH